MEFTLRPCMSDQSNARDRTSNIPAASRNRVVPTRAAVITPPGRGALATVQVRGPDAVKTVAIICRSLPEIVLRKFSDGRLWMTRWGKPEGEPVVIHVHGPELIEVHCHGGPMPLQTIFQGLETQGVRQVPWSEFARQTARDPIAAAAAEALAQAPTLRTAAILLDQFHGAISKCIGQLQESLRQGRAEEFQHGISQLLARAELGRHLIVPWRIAIVGRPNVGKSSLLNAMVGFDRAIVHPTAGTTRDLVTATTAIDGWPVELCDSAGIRVAQDAIESAGIERTRQAIGQSDIQIVVLDRNQPLTDEDHAIIALCPRPTPVANKSDLPAAWDLSAGQGQALPVCSLTRTGFDELMAHLGRKLVPNSPIVGEAIPFTSEQVDGIQLAEQSLELGDSKRANEALHEILCRSI